jgi:hypothetical protein
MNIFENDERDVAQVRPGDPEFDRLPGWVRLRLQVPPENQTHLALLIEGDVWRFSSLDRAVMTLPEGKLYLYLTVATSDRRPDWWQGRHWAEPGTRAGTVAYVSLDSIQEHLDYSVD